MSFRTRLTLFFVLIVIVPMLSVAVIVFRLISENETGKADARVAEGQAAARGLYTEYSDEASAALERVAKDSQLAQALTSGNPGLVRRRATALAADAGLKRLTISSGGRVLVDVGSRSNAIAAARRDLATTPAGPPMGRLEGSTVVARSYALRVKRISSLDVVVRRAETNLAATGPPFTGHPLPNVGTLEVSGSDFRVVSFEAPDFAQGRLRIAVASSSEAVSDAVRSSRLLAILVIAGFLVLALAFGVAVSRSLQAQIGRFLDAARRIGGGDFSTEVPTEGRDEFADLGEEFNKMSRQLEARLQELREGRQQLESSIRRIGDTFTSTLDRERLLEIVVRSAVEGIGAACGRASINDAAGVSVEGNAHAGDVAGFEEVLGRAERDAVARSSPAEAALNGHSALAMPLRPSGRTDRALGLIAVARGERPFTQGERDLFNYLAGRAAVSIENVDLHDLVHQQAVTDELTGLFNHRRFQEVVAREVERARRFEQDVGLLMLDIDDFKNVNDTWGHQQGDLVLREVARVLRESSREIDEPARYGGEELAVALPQTDLAGAYRVGERIRTLIEALEVLRLDGRGSLRVTVSVGVAAMPETATGKDGLIASADAALYEAKRGGKNRTARAGHDPTRAVPGGYA